jgi:hypothetical protein
VLQQLLSWGRARPGARLVSVEQLRGLGPGPLARQPAAIDERPSSRLARKLLDWPKRSKLAHAFLRESS